MDSASLLKKKFEAVAFDFYGNSRLCTCTELPGILNSCSAFKIREYLIMNCYGHTSVPAVITYKNN